MNATFYEQYADKFITMGIEFAPKLLGAVVLYFVGSWAIKWLGKLMNTVMSQRHYDPSLQTFLSSLVKIVLTVVLLITVVGMLGVNTTSFAALLAGAGLAIGAALNGTLGNLAGGVMLLMFKPFKVGDLLEAQGNVGVVTDMGIFSTIILTPENKTVILPNGALSTGIITNLSAHGSLRVDLVMAIAADQSIEKAKSVAVETMLANDKVLKNPAPSVNVLKAGDGMITLAVRPFCNQPDYWDVYFGITEAVKEAFDKNNIAAPVPTTITINK
ncbi:MAG: Small-conductance mechanosensitive channel [Bacteroidota bacterium]|jgi:small conductance mechanosensitive channel